MTSKPEKKKSTKRLVLLDSHAILHRAFHAIPDFATSKGEPTGALYGLISMLLKVVHELKPDYIIATRDLPGGTYRHELFEEYKATRVEADPALVEQLKKAPEVFEAFGIPVYACPGFEADDIIGTIVEQLKKSPPAGGDIEVIIATGDLDTLQLVSGEKVRVYTLRQGISDTILYDEDRVRERYGFGPEFISDYKGLRGDPSDNIKGIKGIGEKTAEALITEFGSIEDIYTALKSNPGEFEKAGVKKRIVELLKEGEKDARFSKELATIHAEAPITFMLPEKSWRLSEYLGTIDALCDALEFRSLKERVRTRLGEEKRAPETPAQLSLEVERNVDPRTLSECAVALWLVKSDITNPTLDDILSFAKTQDFEKARETVFATLHQTGRLREVFETIEKPLIPIVARMNADGVRINKDALEKMAGEYREELGEIAQRIFDHVGHEFNINSPRQLAGVLYDELKLSNGTRTKKTPTGARTTREEELAKMRDAHPVIDDILAYRELQKLLSTYVEKMTELVDARGRLHAEFLQAGTTTGRMASQNPNLQNIPIRTEYGRRIRHAFEAPKDSLLAALDYSQIELRVAAGLSGDEKLLDIFKRGGDVHAAVAAQVFGVPREFVDKEMRRRAKVINFGIIYGMGVNALRVSLGESVSREEAARFLSDYFANFAGLAKWIEFTKRSAAQKGYTETFFGRRRYFSGFDSAIPQMRAQAERMAVNAPIQGTQADIIKLAMVRADELIEKRGWREKAKLVLQVHDELVYEVAEDIAGEAALEVRKVMESVVPADALSGVPILAEAALGKNWGELKRIPATS
ncbi:hypothetical protein A3A38_01570 [Candidatus Kaiserbacteria bacterium RIFCSPLOWO2_01_FULL_53_17]|uniref:DNA-directed DNA polymerase n=1 Tax=Candidatus Kaiserbacteria bacterium RIFCSPLOWO2_01_FULL_53_17 TaxID=1798511 RepID=A0A1F6EGW3_9BACT|nr:MAG: hypothetical protein A3A38_01570 [Candidatus Kaiserbacteria bacterium RIFCSPLOWO2_01_FULL_53_17]